MDTITKAIVYIDSSGEAKSADDNKLVVTLKATWTTEPLVGDKFIADLIRFDKRKNYWVAEGTLNRIEISKEEVEVKKKFKFDFPVRSTSKRAKRVKKGTEIEAVHIDDDVDALLEDIRKSNAAPPIKVDNNSGDIEELLNQLKTQMGKK